MSDEFETRIIVLETEQKNIKEDIKELKNYSNEIFDIVTETKEHLSKQNGAIPYISQKIDLVSDKQEQLVNDFGKFTVQSEKNSFKTKVIWGIGGTVLSSVLFIILKILDF